MISKRSLTRRVKMVQMALLIALAILAISLILSLVYEPPLEPPVAVVKRRFGGIAWVKIRRGWVLVIPQIESVETFPVDRFTVTVNPEEVITPDNVGLDISATLYLTPDHNNLEAYWKSGKKEGVSNILKSITEQEIRQWARDPSAPPQTWEEAQSSQNGLVQKLHDDLVKEGGGNPADENNPHSLKSYGVILEKATIGPIKPKGEVAKVKDLEAKEELERKGELSEIRTKAAIAKELAALSKKEREAFQAVRELEILQEGKSGGIFRFSFGGTEKSFLELLKKIFVPRKASNGSASNSDVGGTE